MCQRICSDTGSIPYCANAYAAAQDRLLLRRIAAKGGTTIQCTSVVAFGLAAGRKAAQW